MTKENRSIKLGLFGLWGAWLIILVYVSVLLILGLPGYHQLLINIVSGPMKLPLSVVYYVLGWDLITTVPFYVMAILLFWRKMEDYFALFVSMTLIVYGVGFSSYIYRPELYVGIFTSPLNIYMVGIPQMLGLSLSVSTLFLFPTGTFMPRWTRWLAIGWTIWVIGGMFIPSFFLNNLPSPLITCIKLCAYVAGIAAQVYRYHHISTPIERQQTKWVIWGCSITVIGFLVSDLICLVVPMEASLLSTVGYLLIVTPCDHIPRVLLALSIGLAILRYHLWDIDFFINRSLVYGGVTLFLGALFAGMFATMQALMEMVLTNISDVVTGTVSTMVVVALFFPVRDRLQCLVDSRFYGVSHRHEREVQIAIAQERDRMARDLHDSVTQSLYGLTLLAESWRRLAQDGRVNNLEEPLIEIGDVAQQALKEMRLLIYEMRSPVLEQEGLLSALHQRLAAVEKRAGVEAELSAEAIVEMSAAIEETLYFVATEALNNAIKYAEASSVTVALRADDKWVVMEITDNGKGYEPGMGGSNGGMGLDSMRRRLEGVGGTLTIHSAPGQGTKVTARVWYQADSRRQKAKVRL
ncbi:MAG: hypothetical protein JXB07_02490 [Anaerolineae bacterium]|nr:hypothetical protein [Anaerolineae bacterium]